MANNNHCTTKNQMMLWNYESGPLFISHQVKIIKFIKWANIAGLCRIIMTRSYINKAIILIIKQ